VALLACSRVERSELLVVAAAWSGGLQVWTMTAAVVCVCVYVSVSVSVSVSVCGPVSV
jgi:hypothetical protein